MNQTVAWILFVVSSLVFVGCVVLFVLQRLALKRLLLEESGQAEMEEKAVSPLDLDEQSLREEASEGDAYPQAVLAARAPSSQPVSDDTRLYEASWSGGGRLVREEDTSAQMLVIQERYRDQYREHSFFFGEDISVGRASANRLVLADPSVSGRHCVLRFTLGGLEVADVGSSNGTLLGNVPLTSPLLVREGDHIWVGTTDLYIKKL